MRNQLTRITARFARAPDMALAETAPRSNRTEINVELSTARRPSFASFLAGALDANLAIGLFRSGTGGHTIGTISRNDRSDSPLLYPGLHLVLGQTILKLGLCDSKWHSTNALANSRPDPMVVRTDKWRRRSRGSPVRESAQH